MKRTPPPGIAHRCEATTVAGLEELAAAEIRQRFGPRASLLARPERGGAVGAVPFLYRGDLRELAGLGVATAVFLVCAYPVPRPRGLLGDEHFRGLLAQAERVRSLAPPGAYRTLWLSAAGADTVVMSRLHDTLAEALGLKVALDEGDLLLRLRRGEGERSWEALIRLTPRPLSARAWRICNMEGALNATVARAMILLSNPAPHDCFLNLACGSGTLLTERAAYGPAKYMLGCDTSSTALACAHENLAAAGVAAELHPWDAGALPLPDASIDGLCADLPFGHLVGSHAQNLTLYPRILNEAARVARQGARFVLISQEVRLTETLLASSSVWQTEQVLRVNLGGLHPRIFVLRRTH